MIIIDNPMEMQKTASRLRLENKTIGFVPTMGALHEGHLSLVRSARKENDIVVVSIFVNPAQFGPNEDYNKYPRTFGEDCSLLEKEKTDYLFFPSNEDMYGKNFETYVELTKLPNHLCGLKREGHFRGVTTVVTKLFNIVKPAAAYFGQKDYQQTVIIKQMALDLNMDIKINMIPTIREKDGLAMSSRNKLLNEKERADALVLYKSLNLGKKLILEGNRKIKDIIDSMEKLILTEVPSAKIDYISIVDPETLEDIKTFEGMAVIAAAVFIGSTRLIDNIEIIL